VTSSTTGFTLGSQYLLDLGGNQATELNGGNWLHSNVWAGGKLLATYDTSGVHFPLTDPLGTKRIQANAAGAVDETCVSLPFGDAQYCTGDDATEHHFTGKERDTESGNDYFEARYYSSAMGRFMSPDWSAMVEPVPYAKLDDPQSLNLYVYVRNNPLSMTDPDGHSWKDWLNPKNWALNLFTLGVATYIHHEIKVTAEHRQYLIDHGYVIVDKTNKEIDLANVSPKLINDAYDQAKADELRQALGYASRIPPVVVQAAAITFGNNPNQYSHTFRHVEDAGIDKNAAEQAIRQDLAGKESSLPQGLTKGQVNVGGRTLEYNAYKLSDGTINVGRIKVQ
jgi:RHS repeat-associated protein